MKQFGVTQYQGNLVCEHTIEVNVCFSSTLLFFSQDEKIDEDQKIEQHQVLYGNF